MELLEVRKYFNWLWSCEDVAFVYVDKCLLQEDL